MIKPGKDLRVYDNTLANNKSFYTGHMNLQTLEFDPFVSGYSFILWTKLPDWFEREFPGFRAMTQKNFKGFQGIEDMELTVNDYIHTFNENAYQTAATITKSNNRFQVTHQEFSGNPIKNMYQYWVTSIRDPRTGIATYPAVHGKEYAAKNHTGELLYIQTRPDVNNVDKNNIEFAAYYTNVMPTRIPLAHHNYTMGSHEEAQIEQDFTGTLNISPQVDTYAKEMLRRTYSFVSEGMFNPDRATTDVGENITEFNADRGITGSGSGDI